MHYILTITWLTFHEARRRKMALAALLIGLVFVGLYALGFWLILRELSTSGMPAIARTQVYNFLTIAGLYVVHFLAVMLAIFASVDTLAGEIGTHTIQTLVTKPLLRWQIVLGKWLGFGIMMSLFLGMLAGGVILTTRLISGYTPSHALEGIALLIFEALVLIALSLLGGTRLSTLTNGVTLFLLYALAFIGAWVEQIGAILQSQAAVRIGIISSLLLPVEALWRRASYLMQPPISSSFPTPFSVSSVPSPALVIYAGLYGLIALLLAMRVFGKRDL